MKNRTEKIFKIQSMIVAAAVTALSLTLSSFAADYGRAYIPSGKEKIGPGVNMKDELNLVEKTEIPVKYTGYIKEYDKNTNEILFNAFGNRINEAGKVEQTETEIILILEEDIPIIDAVSGEKMEADKINKNQAAYAWTSPIMTRSLPGQTAAYALIVNIPADYLAPLYVEINDINKDEQGNYVIKDQEGADFVFSEEINVILQETKNTVSPDSIKSGSKCIVWISPAVALRNPPIYFPEKIMLL